MSPIRHRRAWTKAQVRAARKASLKPVLERLGYPLSPTGRGNFGITVAGREILVREHFYIVLYEDEGGNAIDFLVKVHGLPFGEAMRLLLDHQ